MNPEFYIKISNLKHLCSLHFLQNTAFYTGRFKNAILEHGHIFPHHTLPMLNKDSGCIKEHPELSPLLSTHPVPVSKSSTLAIPSDDPVLRLVKQKDDHNKDLERIKLAYKCGKSKYLRAKNA